MLPSQTKTTNANNVTLTQSFQTGMNMGKQRIWRHTQLGRPLCFSKGEQGLVDVIRNLVSYDYDNLPDDLLHQDIGILVGYVLTHPEEFPLCLWAVYEKEEFLGKAIRLLLARVSGGGQEINRKERSSYAASGAACDS